MCWKFLVYFFVLTYLLWFNVNPVVTLKAHNTFNGKNIFIRQFKTNFKIIYFFIQKY